MITGPTIRDPLIWAPVSTTTRPISSLAASAVPSIRGSALSSTIRLTSSMSVTLPVSFQYPEMIVEVTLRPVLDQPLDGLSDLQLSPLRRHQPGYRLVYRRGEQVHPDQRQVALRPLRLLLQADNLARVIQFGHTELARIRHLRQHDVRVRPTGTGTPPPVR